MSRFPRIAMCMGLGVLAGGMGASAHADAPQADRPAPAAAGQPAGSESAATSTTTRVKTLGTRLETIVVSGGAVDRHNQRFVDSPAATAVLPMVSETAFLDGEAGDVVESP